MTTEPTMTIKINPVHLAAALGRVAFEEGRKAVPALDPKFCALMKEVSGTPGAIMEVLVAWTKAWHAANIAAPVEGVPMPTATIPAPAAPVTVREFSSIGPCFTLGTLTKRTGSMVYFTTREGRTERRGGARLANGLIHCEPCPSCRDHARTQYPNGYEN